jgi:hypothetical protein
MVELFGSKDMFYLTHEGKKWPIKTGPSLNIPSARVKKVKR